MTAVKKKRRLDSRSDLPLVYDQYKPELEGYIRHRVDSAEDTEDILQDVFYKLTKTDLQENPIEYLSAWLYQAVTNRIIDRRRKKREQALPETRQENEDDYFLDSLSDFLADDGNDPEIMFRNELIREEIELTLSELPPEQRSVFELTEYDGIPYKEIAETTGVPVLVERSSYESSPLGRIEWLKLYGALVGKEDLACSQYDELLAALSPILDQEASGQTVAFFYINSSGAVNVRKSGDYIAKAIAMAGGQYVSFDESGEENALSTMTIQMESFYASAVDADIMIYNSTIDGEIRTIDELLTKSPLLADCKAVQEGSVWCITKNFYQESLALGDLILDVHAILQDKAAENLHFLRKLS